MGNYVTFSFDDGTSVMLEVEPGPGAPSAGRGEPRGDLPEGSAGPIPVARPKDIVARTGKTFSEVLRPLVPLLESVHKTLSEATAAPDEVTVELGLKLSSELSLMVVNSNGEASLTVSAKWVLKNP
jgi:hypothetical protein